MPAIAIVTSLVLLAGGCVVSKDDSNKNGANTAGSRPGVTDTRVSIADISADIAEEDTVATDTVSDTTAALAAITPRAVATIPKVVPFELPSAGPLTLHVQILLDRANFSPGVLTGKWDDNGRHALSWFRIAHGMDSSAVVDRATYEQLLKSSGASPVVVQYAVTEQDLAGPFVSIPSNVYNKAKLDCLCYQSAGEELAERFHSTQSLLRQLNPGVSMSSLRPGTRLWVPNVARDTAAAPPYVTAQVVVSNSGFWTHALDSAGHVVAHYPSTLGNSYDPSPVGDLHIVSVHRNPAFHYQPTLFHEVPDSRPEANLPSGPNSPVGVMWIALSKPHYGIHGNDNPASIGVTQSHGCVRLTNWDAWALGTSVQPGVPVRFQ